MLVCDYHNHGHRYEKKGTKIVKRDAYESNRSVLKLKPCIIPYHFSFL